MFGRLFRSALVVVAIGVFAVPVGVMAAHTFTDVPDDNVFHDDIDWLANAGVTKGCNPPANDMFCPGDVVTRQQMSAFMRRLAVYLGAEDGVVSEADNAATLDGQTSDAYENEVFGHNLTRDFGRSGLLGDAATPAPITSVVYTAPLDGYVSVDYYASFRRIATDTALLVTLSTDPTCVADFDESTAYTWVDTTTEWATASGSMTVPVNAGTNTFWLCGSYESGDVTIVQAAVNGVFSTTGTAIAALATLDSGAPAFGSG